MGYPETLAAFIRDGLQQSALIQIWLIWMTLLVIAVPLLMLSHPGMRTDSMTACVSTAVLAVLMPYAHAEVGFTRLLGIVQVLVLVPLLVGLFARKERLVASPPLVRWTVLALATTSFAYVAVSVFHALLRNWALWP